MTLGDERVQELLTGLIRVGRVSEIGTDGRVRVTFSDRDGIESGRLLVCQGRTVGQLDASMPTTGEPVLCLMLPPDQIDGFVVGSLYDAKQAPPTGDQTVRVIAGTDLRLGSVAAAHKIPLGDALLKILLGLREMLGSVVVATPSGPGQLTGVTTDYGSGPFAAIATQMIVDISDAVLLSQKIRVEE